MAKYIVQMAVDGRIDVEVEADSVAEAFDIATDAIGNVKMGDVEFVDAHPVNCMDEHGNMEDYNE